MAVLSNGHGAIELANGRVWGRRGGVPLGDMPLPVTPDDVKLFFSMCLSRVQGRECWCGDTGRATAAVMVEPHHRLARCEACEGRGEVTWPLEDGGSPPLVCIMCDGFGWTFHPTGAT